jgi:PAS domain S-box-containing protein
MWQILPSLMGSTHYMPHGYCYLWQTPLVLLHVISNMLIALAYFSIPAMLIYCVYKRSDVPFLRMFILFGAFILSCGVGHGLDVWTLWYPNYWISGLERAVTALVSCYTAAEMMVQLPGFLSLKTPEQLAMVNQELELEVVERRRVQAALAQVNDELEARGRERTNELTRANAALEAEIAIRTQAEATLTESTARLQRQQSGLVELATSHNIYTGHLPQALQEITAMATHTLQVERGSVWFYNSDRSTIECQNLHELSLDRHSSDVSLILENYPHYAQALEQDRIIAVSDAHRDPRTCEFSQDYLTPLGIGAMLDAAIIFQGQTVGVICLEHVGESRTWAIEEQNFAGYLASVVAGAMEARDRHGAELAVLETRNLYQQILDAIPDFILCKQAESRIVYGNRAFRDYYGMTQDQLQGMIDAPFVQPDYTQQYVRDDAQVFTTGQLLQIEEPVVRWDGVEKMFSTIKSPIFNSQGDVVQTVGISRDITERKALEESLRQTAKLGQAIARILQRMRQTLDLETIFRTTTHELRQVLDSDRVVVYRFNPDWSGQLICESVAAGWPQVVTLAQSEPTLTQIAVQSNRCTITNLNYLAEDTDSLLEDIPLDSIPDTNRDNDTAESCTNESVRIETESDHCIKDTYLQENQGGFYRQGTHRYRCVTDIYETGFSPCYLELLERLQVRAYLIVPIFSSSRLWGLLATYQNSGPRQWQPSDIKIMTQVGAQLGSAVQQAELLTRTQQQAEELLQARDAANAANRAKSEFLANMSHELRTPLNAILGFTQLMEHDRSLSLEHQQYLGTIGRSGEHLLDLINDILAMSKIEAGRISLNETNFDLQILLDSLQEMMQIKAQDKGLQLLFERDLHLPQQVRMDEGKLRQVLLNLLSNAIKFTQNGSVILRARQIHPTDNPPNNPLTQQPIPQPTQSLTTGVEAKPVEFPASNFVGSPVRSSHGPGGQNYILFFEVEDSGAGIAPEEINLLFEAFRQTETGIRSGEGTGLGLPISQQFVRLMGGEIQVITQVGQGSIFSFQVRAKPTDGQAITTLHPKQRNVVGLAPGQPTYRILIVEDRAVNRLVLLKFLQALAFEVREAENGAEAIAQWEQWKPHLIWMDIQMPVMDGYEATRRIKSRIRAKMGQNPQEQDTAIIALTATAFEEDRQAILAAGCDDFVRKPFRSTELLAKMEQHLGVTLIYAEEVEPDTNAPLILEPQALQVMSQGWLEQVNDAAILGNDRALLALIEQISPEHPELARALMELVDNFQFDKIMVLTAHGQD